MVVGRKSGKTLSGKDDSNLSIKDSNLLVKQKTHEELEIEIQTNRVLYVLDEAIKKLKIGALLGYLTQNSDNILSNYLLPQDIEFITTSCEQYIGHLPGDDENKSLSSAVDSTSARFNERSLLIKEKYDVNLLQCVDIIHANNELMQHLAEMDAEIDPLSASLIEGMIELRHIAQERLSKSAAEERENEHNLRNAFKDNIEAKMLIQGLQERLDKQNEELQVQLEAKDSLIKMYTQKIEMAQQKFKEDIKKRVVSSEKSMIQHSQISEERQQILSQQAKEATHNYAQLLEQHLAAERILRAKRYKVEAQLGGWLEKYDKDIGDRQAELENLQAQYDQEKAEMDALQQKFDEQEEEYLELMAERDEYEERIYNERAYAFLTNRAARRIQRYWHAYRERKKARKKARKDKKKKGKGSAIAAQVPESTPVETDDHADALADLGFGDDEEPPPVEAEEAVGEDDKKKKEKGKGKGKGGKGGKAPKKDKSEKSLGRGDDPSAALLGAFGGDVFEDISDAPMPTDVKVEL